MRMKIVLDNVILVKNRDNNDEVYEAMLMGHYGGQPIVLARTKAIDADGYKIDLDEWEHEVLKSIKHETED